MPASPLSHDLRGVYSHVRIALTRASLAIDITDLPVYQYVVRTVEHGQGCLADFVYACPNLSKRSSQNTMSLALSRSRKPGRGCGRYVEAELCIIVV